MYLRVTRPESFLKLVIPFCCLIEKVWIHRDEKLIPPGGSMDWSLFRGDVKNQ